MEMKKLLMNIMIVITVVITVLLSAQQGQGCGSVPTPGEKEQPGFCRKTLL